MNELNESTTHFLLRFEIVKKLNCRIGKQNLSGWGRDRTVDLTIFSRTLIPTELPSRLPKYIVEHEV
jgi:hypothetical protein